MLLVISGPMELSAHSLRGPQEMTHPTKQSCLTLDVRLYRHHQRLIQQSSLNMHSLFNAVHVAAGDVLHPCQ